MSSSLKELNWIKQMRINISFELPSMLLWLHRIAPLSHGFYMMTYMLKDCIWLQVIFFSTTIGSLWCKYPHIFRSEPHPLVPPTPAPSLLYCTDCSLWVSCVVRIMTTLDLKKYTLLLLLGKFLQMLNNVKKNKLLMSPVRNGKYIWHTWWDCGCVFYLTR